MTFVTKSVSCATLAIVTVLVPSLAAAQNEEAPRLRVSFAPAVATVAGDAELALGGTFGYRFSEHFWFEGDVTWIDAAAGGFGDGRFDVDGLQPGLSSLNEALARTGSLFGSRRRGNALSRFPGFPNLPGEVTSLVAETDGSTLIGTLGIRYELPVQTARFRPYLSGGLGINNTEQEIHFDATPYTDAMHQSVTHTGFAFGAGAGASIRVFKQLWADMDARYFRLSQDRNIMRLGGGASVRF